MFVHQCSSKCLWRRLINRNVDRNFDSHSWLTLTRSFFHYVYLFSSCESYDQVTEWCSWYIVFYTHFQLANQGFFNVWPSHLDQDTRTLIQMKRNWKNKISCVLCEEPQVDLNGDMIEDEKFEGECGPLSWSKWAITFRYAGHLSGSISWYSDPLTWWWTRLFIVIIMEDLRMALEEHQPILPYIFLNTF